MGIRMGRRGRGGFSGGDSVLLIFFVSFSSHGLGLMM